MFTKTEQQFKHLEFMQEILNISKGFPLVLRGGTAIALYYGSGRFSEDLDFSISEKFENFQIYLEKLGSLGYDILFRDSKYLQFLKLEKEGIHIHMEIEKEVNSNFSYEKSTDGVKICPLEYLLNTKISTFLDRKKSRDLYDISFLSGIKNFELDFNLIYSELRKNETLKKRVNNNRGNMGFYIIEEFKNLINDLNQKDFKKDLNNLVPRLPSKKEFENNLRKNFSRYWNFNESKEDSLNKNYFFEELNKLSYQFKSNLNYRPFIDFPPFRISILQKEIMELYKVRYGLFMNGRMLEGFKDKEDMIKFFKKNFDKFKKHL